MTLRIELYRELHRFAVRCSRRAEEAEELMHDVLLDALRRGFEDWESPERRLWLQGALRRRAAFLARSAARGRAREERYGSEAACVSEFPETRGEGGGAAGSKPGELPPALRSVALLLAAGLNREEVRFLLGLSDAALRQRIHQLRQRLPLPLTPQAEDTGLAWGKLRRALLEALRREAGWTLGSHDPDGHLLLFSESPSSSLFCSREVAPRQPSSAEPSAPGAPEKGSSC